MRALLLLLPFLVSFIGSSPVPVHSNKTKELTRPSHPLPLLNLTPEQQEQIRELYKSGQFKTKTALANHLGISLRLLERTLKNQTPPVRPVNNEAAEKAKKMVSTIKKIKELMEAGNDIEQISAHLGMSIGDVIQFLRHMNVPSDFYKTKTIYELYLSGKFKTRADLAKHLGIKVSTIHNLMKHTRKSSRAFNDTIIAKVYDIYARDPVGFNSTAVARELCINPLGVHHLVNQFRLGLQLGVNIPATGDNSSQDTPPIVPTDSESMDTATGEPSDMDSLMNQFFEEYQAEDPYSSLEAPETQPEPMDVNNTMNPIKTTETPTPTVPQNFRETMIESSKLPSEIKEMLYFYIYRHDSTAEEIKTMIQRITGIIQESDYMSLSELSEKYKLSEKTIERYVVAARNVNTDVVIPQEYLQPDPPNLDINGINLDLVNLFDEWTNERW